MDSLGERVPDRQTQPAPFCQTKVLFKRRVLNCSVVRCLPPTYWQVMSK